MISPLKDTSAIALRIASSGQSVTIEAVLREAKGTLPPLLVAEYCEGWRWREDREYPPDTETEWERRGYADAQIHFGYE
jgi:hypothetical protein